MSNKLLSYEDVAKRWQLAVNTLRVWVMQKRLKPIKLGSKVRFKESYISEIESKGLPGC